MKNVSVLKDEEVRELGKQVMIGNEAKQKLNNKNLSQQERDELMMLYNKGIKARDIIHLHNQKLVTHIAKSFVGRGVDFEDLFQSGSMGLITAIEKYDYRKENLFSTYAGLWIKQNIQRTIINESRSIRLPDNVYKQTYKCKKTYNDLSQLLNREPTVEEVAKKLGVSLKQVLDYMDYSKGINSLDAKVKDDDDSTYADIVCDETTLSPEKKFMKNKLNDTLYKTIKGTLTAMEAFALYNYYGLNGTEKRNYEEIGRELGFSGERARQLVVSSIKKLRESSNANELKMLMANSSL